MNQKYTDYVLNLRVLYKCVEKDINHIIKNNYSNNQSISTNRKILQTLNE